jgi:Ca-activated chloride channel family protein
MPSVKVRFSRAALRARQRFALLVALATSIPAPLAAQQPESKIRVDVNLVLVEATVKDKAGRAMGDLQKDDFLIDEDGAAQQIAHFSRDQLPLAVVLVVDLSNSIEPFIKPLRYATLTALKALKPEDEVALFTFSTNVQQRVRLTRDKRAVSDEIEFFHTGGATNINGAIYDAANYLREQAPAARRVIVLVSDNVPTTQVGVSHDGVAKAALEADGAVYSLKVPGQNPWQARMASKAHGMVNVDKLTAETGGEVFDVEKQGSLFLAFQALIERLKTRYTIGFYPARNAPDGNFHRLNLRLQPKFGGKGRDYAVLSKTGYYALRSQQARP